MKKIKTMKLKSFISDTLYHSVYIKSIVNKHIEETERNLIYGIYFRIA